MLLSLSAALEAVACCRNSLKIATTSMLSASAKYTSPLRLNGLDGVQALHYRSVRRISITEAMHRCTIRVASRIIMCCVLAVLHKRRVFVNV